MTAQDELQELTYDSDGSDQRLKELILYLADKCVSDDRFGATKLNKLLYYIDFYAFARRGRSVTGAEYMGLPEGPVPRRLLAVKEDMKTRGEAVEREVPVYSYTQKRLTPLRDANLELFSAADIALVDDIVSQCWDFNAKQLSDMSHDRVWRIAGPERGPIPYEAVYISPDDLTVYDVARTKELVEENEWAR